MVEIKYKISGTIKLDFAETEEDNDGNIQKISEDVLYDRINEVTEDIEAMIYQYLNDGGEYGYFECDTNSDDTVISVYEEE